MHSSDRSCDDLLQQLAKLDEGESEIVLEMRRLVTAAHSSEVREALGQWTHLAGEQRRRLASAASALRPEDSFASLVRASNEGKKPAGRQKPLRWDDRPLLARARTLANWQAAGYASAFRCAREDGRLEAAELLQICLERAEAIEALLSMVADEINEGSSHLAA